MRAVALGVVGGLVVATGVTWATARPPVDDLAAYGDRSLLADGPTRSYTGSQVTVTDSMRAFARTVRVGERDLGLVFDRTELVCHGGRAVVAWHTGNLEPTVPDTGIQLTAYLDGEPIGSLIKGSTRGIYNDGPVTLHTVIDCPEGLHVLDIRIVHITGSWAVPFTDNIGADAPPGRLVGRGFVMTEVWD